LRIKLVIYPESYQAARSAKHNHFLLCYVFIHTKPLIIQSSSISVPIHVSAVYQLPTHLTISPSTTPQFKKH